MWVKNTKFICYRTKLDGFAVAKFNLTEDGCSSDFIAVGNFKGIEGETFDLEGEWVTNEKYGKQFKIVSYIKIKSMSNKEVVDYLLTVDGIGESKAKKIVSYFDKDTLKVIQSRPSRLQEIGISDKDIDNIVEKIGKNLLLNDLIEKLEPYNIPLERINQIVELYKEKSFEVINNNPYQMCFDMKGFCFTTADKIAKGNGNISMDSEYRLKASILYVLDNTAPGRGHSYLPFKELVEITETILNKDNTKKVDPNIISKVLIDMRNTDELVIENDGSVYHPLFYNSEKLIAKKILSLLKSKFNKTKIVNSNTNDIYELINKIQQRTNISYEMQQVEAIFTAVKENFCIITGGPGTGKTTIIKAIISLLHEIDETTTITLASPTGKAAKRMEESTGFNASTIHRLLEFRPNNNELTCDRNEFNPIDTDVIILDECSMLDVLLTTQLVKAIKEGTKVILVGDVDQLPSVGPGNVLKDMIISEVIPVIKLNKIFRQKDTSTIIINANKINTGEFPVIGKQDFDMIFESDPKKIANHVVKAYIEGFQTYRDLERIQVLTPRREKTILCSNHLNILLQDKLNPYRENNPELDFYFIKFRCGDKVIQTRNNYEKAVFNGDTGYVKSINVAEVPEMVIDFGNGKEVKYVGKEEILKLSLAYALTIHKSQGSEYDLVIIPVSNEDKVMLKRNLLYTAVSRAKQKILLVGEEGALIKGINDIETTLRYSTLAKRLKGQ